MLIKPFKRKKGGRLSGGLSYVEKDPTCVFLDTKTEDFNNINAQNTFSTRQITGSMNFKEQLTESQAMYEWMLFRFLFVDPYGVPAWSRLHPKENKRHKPKPHSAIHFGIGTRLPDGRHIMLLWGAFRPGGYDFELFDLYKKWRNSEMEFASPDDPTLWSDRTKIQRNWSKACKAFVEALNQEIPRLPFKEDREALIKWLRDDKGLTISRVGQNYVTVKSDSWKTPIRLQGTWWSKEPTKPEVTPQQRSPREIYDQFMTALSKRNSAFENRYHFSKQQNHKANEITAITNTAEFYDRVTAIGRKLFQTNPEISDGEPTVPASIRRSFDSISRIKSTLEGESQSGRTNSHVNRAAAGRTGSEDALVREVEEEVGKRDSGIKDLGKRLRAHWKGALRLAEEQWNLKNITPTKASEQNLTPENLLDQLDADLAGLQAQGRANEVTEAVPDPDITPRGETRL